MPFSASRYLFIALSFMACNSPIKESDDQPYVDSCAMAIPFEGAKIAGMLVSPEYSGDLKNYRGDNQSEIDFIHTYQAGKLIKSVYYYENGNVQEELPFACGSLHGVVKRYYEDGIIAQTIPYRFGRREGTGEQFNKTGKLTMQVTFKADSIINTKKF